MRSCWALIFGLNNTWEMSNSLDWLFPVQICIFDMSIWMNKCEHFPSVPKARTFTRAYTHTICQTTLIFLTNARSRTQILDRGYFLGEFFKLVTFLYDFLLQRASNLRSILQHSIVSKLDYAIVSRLIGFRAPDLCEEIPSINPLGSHWPKSEEKCRASGGRPMEERLDEYRLTFNGFNLNAKEFPNFN